MLDRAHFVICEHDPGRNDYKALRAAELFIQMIPSHQVVGTCPTGYQSAQQDSEFGLFEVVVVGKIKDDDHRLAFLKRIDEFNEFGSCWDVDVGHCRTGHGWWLVYPAIEESGPPNNRHTEQHKENYDGLYCFHKITSASLIGK